MGMRMIVLSSLIVVPAGAMVMAGPPLLVPAPGSPLRLGPGRATWPSATSTATELQTSW
jgi:hypothetical protein